MPVDKFGWIVGEDESAHPADRYAVPINRKPKKKSKDYLWLVGAAILLLFLAGLASISTHPTHTTQKSDWHVSFIHNGIGSTKLASVEVSGTWRFTWACPVTGKAMSEMVKDEQGTILWFDTIECTKDDHDGSMDIPYTGQVSIEMNAVGSWTVSIEEPTQ